ncbi:stage II sporulation protein M [Mycetocola zhadangensis]|uniref:Stage II sporulation protein M n=1 Tax=Mycetocola zhadangensis TaxID=1164595 RepID=A0A3L7IWA4_9MICO|nr:stage II sporulation protein M [Mycetocola zhadangensis]RLQ81509.1 stage II sporulation protein M [Mycetocola zhadangensis]RLQ82463.1 stage II sporulation protein M [Mycetocola zhadangensis]GGF01109.1 membrane protein [Mycetocola zhadangensis]
MDLDAYSAAHRNDWDRLDALASKRSLSGAEADELIDRYQAGATQLSAIKTTAGSTRHGDRLSVTLSKSRLRFTSASANVLSQLPRFFVLQLPAALYRLRWLTLAVALVTVGVAALWAAWVLNDPQVLANLGSTEELRRVAEEDFANYYSDNPAASFAGQVWTNNAWIAAQCIAFGITGIWVPYVILQNAQNLGLNAAVLFSFGEGDTFFLYIAPHGLLELTAIFVAAAGGLRIFWAWVAPGKRTRGQALAEDARALFTVAIGLVFVLLVSGILEGFVTPQPWPWPVKIGLGAAALGAFLFYMLVVGRRAYRAGETGDLAAFEAGARRIYAN